ncbi:MAG: sensor histidine kinase [Chloroflexota bacterium]
MIRRIFSQAQTDSISERYQLLAIVIYIGTLIVAVFSWTLGRPPRAPVFDEEPVARFVIFAFAIVALLILDLQTINAYGLKLSPKGSRLHLFARVLLLTVAFVTAGLELTIFVYLLLSLYAYLTTGRTAALTVAGVSFIALFARLAYGPRNDFISVGDFEQLLGYSLMTVFALLLGNIITEEAKSKEHAHRLLDGLTESHQQLEESMAQVADLAATEERNRMARDIHDGLGHYLAAINVQLEMVVKLYDQQPELAKEAAVQAKAATQAALSDVRQSVSTLRDGGERFQLRTALDRLVNQLETDNLQIQHELEGDEASCSQPILLTLYRAAQEGLTNVVKHASATEVELKIQLLPSHATLNVADNGVGFDVASLESKPGYGLQGIRERVALVRGHVKLDSKPGEGAILNLKIPY